MGKRDQQKEERRQQILDCSLDLIITRGFDAMKIRDIAEKLDISIGLFFNYFSSKENVYEELVKIGISGPQSLMQFDVNQVDHPIELFSFITDAVFDYVRSDSFVAKMFILMGQTMKNESVPESVKAIASKFDAYTPLIPVIEKGQRQGEIKQGNSLALIITYWSAIQGIAETIAIRPELPIPEPDWIVDILRP